MNDLDRFKQTYINECFELLTDMEDRLIALEPNSNDSEQLNAIFRCAHSIKGGAGAFGFDHITKFTHQLEALLDLMREGKVSPTIEIVQLLLKSGDVLRQMIILTHSNSSCPKELGEDIAEELIKLIDQSNNEELYNENPENTELDNHFLIDFIPHENLFNTGNEPLLILRELKKLGKMTTKVNYQKLPDIFQINPTNCYLSWNIEIVSDFLESKILEVFEFVTGNCDLHIKTITKTDHKNEIASKSDVNVITKKEEAQIDNEIINTAKNSNNSVTEEAVVAPPSATSIRVDLEKVDRLVNIIGELVITETMLQTQSQTSNVLLKGMDELSLLTRELQDAAMSIRMQPVKSIFSRFSRIVRDLSIKLGKNVKIVTSGENTEVDKTVIEQLNDPLTHMIRNAIDHGIETPETRVKNGKAEQGMIHLSASHRGGRIFIEIADDGAGINRDKVLRKAISKGFIDPDDKLPNNEIDNLIFMAGLSTSEEVTDISGRGVGMDVVGRNIQNLGGSIDIKNNPGFGTIFSISLPLTLAILDGMIIRVGNENYIIPITIILESMRPKIQDIRKVNGYKDIINIRGEFIPILYLYKIFNIQNAEKDLTKALVVLVENRGAKIGLVVDELIGQQQVVIKSLEANTDPVKGVSGATILGDGNVSLILETNELYTLSESNV